MICVTVKDIYVTKENYESSLVANIKKVVKRD
jgi:hypothetical protein